MQKFISIFLTSLLMVNGINNEALSQTNDEEFSETKNRVESSDYKVGDFELYNGEEIIDEYRYSAKLLNGSNDYIILYDKVWQTKSGSMGNVSVSSNDDWFGSSKKSLDKYVIPLEGYSVFKYNYYNQGNSVSTSMGGGLTGYLNDEEIGLISYGGAVGRPSSGVAGGTYKVAEINQKPINFISCYGGGGSGHSSQSCEAKLTKWLEEIEGLYVVITHDNDITEVDYYDTNAIYSLKELEKRGYEFIGWYNNEEKEGYPIREIAIGSEGKRELWSGFKAIEYPIIYNLNGGENNLSNPSHYTIEDEIIIEDPLRKGYIFDGWNEMAIIEKGNVGTKSFNAKWNIIDYDIKYELDGGTNNQFNPSTYTIEDTILLKEATKEGFRFKGWNDEDGKTITIIPKGRINDITLKAEYEAIEYRIKYKMNGAINNVENPAYYKTDEGFVLKEPTKKGLYKFNGWKLNGKFIKEIKPYEIIGDITLEAVFETTCNPLTDKNCDGVVTCDEEKEEGWIWNSLTKRCELKNKIAVLNTGAKC